MTSFLHAYFTRLHCQPLGVPTVEALRTLHLAHNCAIPFENLDVLLPREIQLDETALEEKLLYARRGGYCFELNGLFERALRDIGFNVRSLLGRLIPPVYRRARTVCCWLMLRMSSGSQTWGLAAKR